MIDNKQQDKISFEQASAFCVDLLALCKKHNIQIDIEQPDRLVIVRAPDDPLAVNLASFDEADGTWEINLWCADRNTGLALDHKWR